MREFIPRVISKDALETWLTEYRDHLRAENRLVEANTIGLVLGGLDDEELFV